MNIRTAVRSIRRGLRKILCGLRGHPTASRKLGSNVWECDWCGWSRKDPKVDPTNDHTDYKARHPD